MGPGLVLASPSLLPSLPRARPRGCPSRPGTPAGQQGASAPVPEAPFRSPGISVPPRSPRGRCGVQKLPGLNAARSAQQCPGCTGWRAPSKAAAGHRGRAPAAPGCPGSQLAPPEELFGPLTPERCPLLSPTLPSPTALKLPKQTGQAATACTFPLRTPHPQNGASPPQQGYATSDVTNGCPRPPLTGRARAARRPQRATLKVRLVAEAQCACSGGGARSCRVPCRPPSVPFPVGARGR
ncbi:uncharacterized protein LOC128898543 [Dryobates pubescens]|uniref:uncharacterized protein LOC128898543 n=1 Tax=Dryobates pubescens TaxID=118200 RepID=UPI0023B90F8E|nr:uncharacterized protein LOC128898543 [Dryobates pubescens]